MICKREKCYGCYACYNICPKNAIMMCEDKYGHIYPEINKEKCVSCGMCKIICPGITMKKKLKEPISCYAAFSRDNYIHKTSSSGGVAIEFSKKILESKGVVYAVSSYLDEDKEISFTKIDDNKNLCKIQGSKYVHAYIKYTLREIKRDLDEGKQVLFVGTPCQVAGLYNFLGRNNENLICIDLICHGVPSQKMLKEEIGKDFDYIKFRGQEGFKLIAKKNNKIVSRKNQYESDYFYAFLEGIGYRKNCYECKFATKKRIGDLTIGDFWGYKKIKQNEGISLVLVNTKKGELFFREINNLNTFEADIDVAIKGNSQLYQPTLKTEKAICFENEYDEGNYKRTIHGINGLKKTFYIKVKGKLKRIRDKVIRLWN